MSGTDHTTRTLLLSRKVPGTLIVTRGSTENIDPEAASVSSGHSEVKAFNLTNQTSTYNFDTDGLLLGWGLRNDVGVDEEPISGGIYTVENSVDQMNRSGQDIHLNNPGEELNFLGYLNGTSSPNEGKNFGYPECFAAWNVSEIPDQTGAGLQVGEQFAIGTLNATNNDTLCAERVAPRDRVPPVGYKLSLLTFANGSPTEPSNSTTAALDVVSNTNLTACPNGCLRPVGLAWDSQGRLFMSSDSTGEIYVVLRADGNATSSVGSSEPSTVPGYSGGASGTTAAPSATGSTKSEAGMGRLNAGVGALAAAAAVLVALL
ncbi:hypothetical protein M8818_006925 [Zalaria obscura]|uniref:Uncharacterized protein n=1 Tax=Zalaria obscura TaxID=2024903 RepID=A0ACC3S6C1_9PEZI